MFVREEEMKVPQNVREEFDTSKVNTSINATEHEDRDIMYDDVVYHHEQDPRAVNVVARVKEGVPYYVVKDDLVCAQTATLSMKSMLSESYGLKPTVQTSQDLQDAISRGDASFTLMNNIVGSGIKIPEGSNFILDLNGHSYTVVDPTVGDTGTQTLGFQLLKDSNIVFKNGTINTATDGCKMLVQNYSNLTLSDVTLDGTGSSKMQYVLSNNNGDTLVSGNTNVIAPEGATAIDAYYWPKAKYESVHVTIDTTGTIAGRMVLSSDGTKSDEEFKANASLVVNSGKFTVNPVAFLAEGKTVVEENGKFVVA